MRRRSTDLVITLVFGILSVSISRGQNVSPNHSEVPRIISYQGLLSSSEGRPLASGDYRITIRLYGDEQGKEQVWQGTYSTTIRDGLFDLQLGSGDSPLPDAKSMDRALWLGIQVGEGVEMTPRTPLRAVPYALAIPDRSVTAAKLATDYVSSIMINGQKVTEQGSSFNITGGAGIDLRYDSQMQGLTIGLRDGSLESDEEKGAKVQAANSPPGGGTPIPWSEDGNNGTVPGTNYVGTSDNVALEIHVDDGGSSTQGRKRVMLYEPNATSPNLVGGYNGNLPGTGGAIVGVTIGGGGQSGNVNDVRDDFGTIGGGDANVAGGLGGGSTTDDAYATIGGGQQNQAQAAHSTVGGGRNNQAQAMYSAVAGGQANNATDNWSIIGGGVSNQAGNGGAIRTDAQYATVGGGQFNQAQATHSVVGGGQFNTSTDNWSFVGGGQQNQAGNGGPIQSDAQHATVGGGQSNIAQANHALIGGGQGNNVTDDWSTIAGGDSNQAGNATGTLRDAAYATVGGGRQNFATGGESTVSGGNDNLAQGFRATVGGGFINNVFANRGTIGGGEANIVGMANLPGIGSFPLVAQYATIGGGAGNNALGDYSAIAGGSSNASGGNYSAVGGGLSNAASALYTTVAGGLINNAYDEYATVAGGYRNIAGTNDGNATSASFTTVSGGDSNQAGDQYATIGGGHNNIASGKYSTIGGGDNDYTGGEIGTVGGGRFNRALPYGATIAGGDSNLISDDYGAIGGGKHNVVGAAPLSNDQTFATVSGGEENWANGNSAAIAGGRYLEVGDYSFGFNGDASAVSPATQTTNVAGFPGTAYFGNVNLWIGNVNGTPRELRFYAANSSYDYSGVGNPGSVAAKYTGFKAGTVNANTIYTMPSAYPTVAGSFLTSSTTGVMSWATALPVASGGTNSSATPTAGGVAFGTGTAYAFTVAGTSGQLLVSGGAGAPTWQNINVTGWSTSGNGGTTPGTGAGQHYLGTSDAKDLIIATQGTERMKVASSGAVTVASGLTVTSGGAIVSSGGLGVTSGGLTVTSGGATVTGNSSVTGSLNLAGTTSPLLLNGNAGTANFVLMSNGAGSTPSWTNANTLVTGSWNSTGDNTTTGKIGIGSSSTPLVSVDIAGGLAIQPVAAASSPSAKVTLVPVTVGNRSYIRISTDGSATTREVTLSDGKPGQVLVIECIGNDANPYTGTNGFRIKSRDNVRLAGDANRDFARFDTLTLIWDPDAKWDSGDGSGSDTGRWIQLAVSNN